MNANFRITPNGLTLLGLPFGVFAGFLLAGGHLRCASFFLFALSACDFFDGRIAKKMKLTTEFGAFLDSTVDRIVELFLFMGIIFLYSRRGDWRTALVAYGGLSGSLVVSYTRARAENFIKNCRVGFWERPERLLLLLLGLLTHHLTTALWILAIGTTLTSLHRILYTRYTLLHRNLPWKTLFWDFPRSSWMYRIAAFAVILVTLFVTV